MGQLRDALYEHLRTKLPVDDDWDDEGAKGISDATVERAVRFLLGSPMSADGEGGIDFTIGMGDAQLLINLPAVESTDRKSYSLIRRSDKTSMNGAW